MLLVTPTPTNGDPANPVLTTAKPSTACHHIEVTWFSPTGTAGCPGFGVGWASYWSGPGVAVNACVYDWTDCQPITIRSLDTGLTITRTPTMFCDCWTGLEPGQTGPNGELSRLVDLDSESLKALGLWDQRSRGLFRVSVEPATSSSSVLVLPNTAIGSTPSE